MSGTVKPHVLYLIVQPLLHLWAALQWHTFPSTNIAACLHRNITCDRQTELGLALWPAVRPSLPSASVCLFVCGSVFALLHTGSAHVVIVCWLSACFLFSCVMFHWCVQKNATMRAGWSWAKCGESFSDGTAGFQRSPCLPLRQSFGCIVNI